MGAHVYSHDCAYAGEIREALQQAIALEDEPDPMLLALLERPLSQMQREAIRRNLHC
jgi:hypothetical protein